MRHNKLISVLIKLSDYIRGLINILHADTPRYSLIAKKIDISYLNNLMMSEITYTPLGCYRPQKKFASELAEIDFYTKFKPQHAKIIIGVHTLESCLDFQKQEHVHIYLSYVNVSIRLLKNE